MIIPNYNIHCFLCLIYVDNAYFLSKEMACDVTIRFVLIIWVLCLKSNELKKKDIKFFCTFNNWSITPILFIVYDNMCMILIYKIWYYVSYFFFLQNMLFSLFFKEKPCKYVSVSEVVQYLIIKPILDKLD